uniref:STRA8 n=1 Tax=Latimeria menadoensis TaxID=106881 RepID=A0A2U9NKT7_LATME|nr:STRA8 [Latimeria menadoensis]
MENSPYARPDPRLHALLQGVEPKVARRRLSQARHRATIAGLFEHLRDTVYPEWKQTTTKWQVLRKTKTYVQELEQTLGDLLKLKGGASSSLEEVKQEYIDLHYPNHSLSSRVELTSGSSPTIWYLLREPDKETSEVDEKPAPSASPDSSPPELVEFEGYLYFYKKTADELVESRIISMEHISLPVVSKAISHLWQNLPREKKRDIFRQCSQRERDTPADRWHPPQVTLCAESQTAECTLDSQGASGSFESTPEEILFEDAFDVAVGLLGRNGASLAASDSSVFPSGAIENPEKTCLLYNQIVSLIKARYSAGSPPSQHTAQSVDYETVLLRCTETFDDEDL